jgi:gamma-glutamyltranspeptidase/glutathione hydrolase
MISACDGSTAQHARGSAPLPAPLSSAPSQLPSLAVLSSQPPATPPPTPAPDREPEPGIDLRAGGKRAVAGKYGVVTSVEAQATRAGVRILEQGGNAVDAAVAAAYALSVTHPSAGSLGGGGFMLVSRKGEVVAIDFRENAPAKLTRARFDAMIAQDGIGPDSVGAPGLVAGLTLAHERFGHLTRNAVMLPAIELARNGSTLGARQALALGWSWPLLGKNRAFVKRYADPTTGKPKSPGSRIRQAELARTLEAIAERGPSAFYEGAIAQQLIDALGPDALLSLEDLAAYRAKLRDPLVFWYRGLRVVTMPPPSAGGVALTQTLLMLGEEKAHAEPLGSALAIHLFVEAAKRAHSERRFHVLDPDVLDSAEFEARRAGWLDAQLLLREHPIDRQHATPAIEIHAFDKGPEESENTTHLSVVDAEGMAVSCTITLSAGFGSKLMSDATGVILNNAVASFSIEGDNLPVGGRRTTSSMAPTFVFYRGQLGLVLGTPGGDTIPNTVVQVLRNVVDYGMTIDQAVDAPRIHHGFIPDEIRFERQRPTDEATLKVLAGMGHHFSKKRLPIGDANDILVSGDTAYAVADRREGGLALAARAPEAPASQRQVQQAKAP